MTTFYCKTFPECHIAQVWTVICRMQTIVESLIVLCNFSIHLFCCYYAPSSPVSASRTVHVALQRVPGVACWENLQAWMLTSADIYHGAVFCSIGPCRESLLYWKSPNACKRLLTLLKPHPPPKLTNKAHHYFLQLIFHFEHGISWNDPMCFSPPPFFLSFSNGLNLFLFNTPACTNASKRGGDQSEPLSLDGFWWRNTRMLCPCAINNRNKSIPAASVV